MCQFFCTDIGKGANDFFILHGVSLGKVAHRGPHFSIRTTVFVKS